MAVWPSSSVLQTIATLPRIGEGWRWTRSDQWHVTLRFLGEADEDVAIAALDEVEHAPVEATVGPSVARLGSGVLMVPVSGLEELAAAVTRATATVGRPPGDRPFVGHLTLARWRGRGRGRSSLIGTEVAGTFHVDEVHLVRSESKPEGPSYTAVAVRRLGG